MKMTVEELNAYLDEVFPEVAGRYVVEETAPNFVRMRLNLTPSDLRPGGTVSGPSMFGLADCAYYAVTLLMIGREPLTVTTNCAINFMRKPEPKDLTAEARILKLGRTLSVGDVTILSPGVEGPVAHASMTYAIPPKRAT